MFQNNGPIFHIYSPRLSSLHSTFLMNWNIHHMKRYLINVFARSMQDGFVIKPWNQLVSNLCYTHILKKFPSMEPISNKYNDKKGLYQTQKIFKLYQSSHRICHHRRKFALNVSSYVPMAFAKVTRLLHLCTGTSHRMTLELKLLWYHCQTFLGPFVRRCLG